jgi:hypothetical protein
MTCDCCGQEGKVFDLRNQNKYRVGAFVEAIQFGYFMCEICIRKQVEFFISQLT